MTHTVTVFPGPVHCGKCGSYMVQDVPHKPGEKFVAISCREYRCEQKGIALAFPITVIELQKVEV